MASSHTVIDKNMNDFSGYPPRSVGIVIDACRILLFRRYKNQEDYYCLPGGGVEKNETEHEAMIREIKEETNFDVDADRFLFSFINQGRTESYYLITRFHGTLAFLGPESLRHDPNDTYKQVWMPVNEFKSLQNFYPKEAYKRIISLFDTDQMIGKPRTGV